MDRRDYVTEALCQLQDKQYYIQLTKPVYKETEERIATELETLYKSKTITKDQLKYLLGPKPPCPRYVYLLPKIHKPRTKWTIPDRIPLGRPIVSDCGSESDGIAEYLEHILTPVSTQHSSYIKYTQHFLSKIRALQLKEPCFLFTMDVCNLYRNIEMVYLQVKGTAMGKRFVPAYANIYMAEWEEEIFKKCKKLPLLYLRYLDDIWGIWTHSRMDFDGFVQIINEHHRSTQVEATTKDTEIDFLNITTFKGPNFLQTGTLDTRMFFKPTDSHSLLHKKKFSPETCLQGNSQITIITIFPHLSTKTGL